MNKNLEKKRKNILIFAKKNYYKSRMERTDLF